MIKKIKQLFGLIGRVEELEDGLAISKAKVKKLENHIKEITNIDTDVPMHHDDGIIFISCRHRKGDYVRLISIPPGTSMIDFIEQLDSMERHWYGKARRIDAPRDMRRFINIKRSYI